MPALAAACGMRAGNPFKSAVGPIALGKNDFEAIEPFRTRVVGA